MSRRTRPELPVLSLEDLAQLLDDPHTTAKQREGIARLLAETIRVEAELARLQLEVKE